MHKLKNEANLKDKDDLNDEDKFWNCNTQYTLYLQKVTIFLQEYASQNKKWESP